MSMTSGVLDIQSGEAARCFVSVDPELTNPESPITTLLYRWEDALHKTAAAMGIEYIVIAGAGAQPPPGFGPRLFATLSDSPAPIEPHHWPAHWSAQRSRDLCDGVLTGLRQRFSDLSSIPPITIYVPNGHPTQIPGLIRLGLALRGRCPIVVTLNHLHTVYGLNRPHRVPGFRELLSATRGLRRVANIHLRVETERLAASIREDTGEDLPLLPFYTAASEQLSDGTRHRLPGSPLRIAYPTALPNRGKGFDLVIALAEKLGRSDVEIVTQESRENCLEMCMPTVAAFAGGLKVLPSFLPSGRYEKMLAQSDLVLIPYPRWQFFSRTSGVLADAIRFGKPVVGTADCWIGDTIDALGAGRTFRDGDADSFVEAVRSALDDLDGLRAKLIRGRQAWVSQNNRAAFLRAVLDTGRPRTISALHRDWLMLKLAFQIHGILSWRPKVVEPIKFSFHRLRQLVRGRAGKLSFYDAAMSAKFTDRPAIAWDARGVAQTELRLGSPDGFRIAKGGAKGNVWWATVWLSSPSWIYLQDVSGGKPSTASHTLARIRFKRPAQPGEGEPTTAAGAARIVIWRFLMRLLRKLCRLPTGNLSISAPTLRRDAGTKGIVSWKSTAPDMVEVTVDGRLFTRTTSSGSAETDRWLRPGNTILLLDSRPSRLPGWFRLLDAEVLSAQPRQAPLTILGRLLRKFIRSGGLERTSCPRQALIAGPGRAASTVPTLSPEAQALLTAVMPNEWGLAPPPTSGEIYLLCAYSRTFLNLYGGERLVIFAPRHYLDLLRLFPDAPVRGVECDRTAIAEFDKHGRIGRVLKLDYEIGKAGEDRVLGRYAPQELGFAHLFLQEAGITMNMPSIQPRLTSTIRAAALDRMHALGLAPGRTVILAPNSSSQRNIYAGLWQCIADTLGSRGFTVATNCGPKESAIPGTVALDISLSELYAAVELAGYLITARSGVCDLCATAKTAMHILWADQVLSAWPGITTLWRLVDNGLPDRATYHEYSFDKPASLYLDEILQHPDFMAPATAAASQ